MPDSTVQGPARISIAPVSTSVRRWLLPACLIVAAASCTMKDAIEDYDPDASMGGVANECAGQPDGTACKLGQVCLDEVCQTVACGDGVPSGDEECDDGNQVDDDGCNNECISSVCGNGYVDPYEDCDDFNTKDGDSCPSDCRNPGPICGDRVIEGDEVCDGPQVGVLGVNASYSCANDCTEKVAYVCEPCQRARCTAYKGRGDSERDVVDGCLEGVKNTGNDPTFLAQCAALVNCALQNRCGADAAYASLGCYCNATEDKTCAESGPADEGACQAEFAAAARSEDPAEIYARLSDFAYPAAWASALLDCYRDQCLGPLKLTDGEGVELDPAQYNNPVEGVETSCFPL